MRRTTEGHTQKEEIFGMKTKSRPYIDNIMLLITTVGARAVTKSGTEVGCCPLVKTAHLRTSPRIHASAELARTYDHTMYLPRPIFYQGYVYSKGAFGIWFIVMIDLVC